MLNTAPETATLIIDCTIFQIALILFPTCNLEFIAAYNLIHLVRQSPKMDKFLPKIRQNLSASVSRIAAHGPGLALLFLTTFAKLRYPISYLSHHSPPSKRKLGFRKSPTVTQESCVLDWATESRGRRTTSIIYQYCRCSGRSGPSRTFIPLPPPRIVHYSCRRRD